MIYRFNVNSALNFQLLCHAHKYFFCMHITFTKVIYCHITNLSYFTGTLFINPEDFVCSIETPYINSFIHKCKSS